MNMPFPSCEQVASIRKNYPPGTRVMLDNMNDPYSPVESGTRGTVRYVDCLLYTSPSPRDGLLSRMPSSA